MINFVLNKKIQVFTEDELKMGNSTVQDEDDISVYISFPMGSKGLIKLQPGEIIRAVYTGEGNKLYEFITEVKEIITDDRIPLIKINKPSEYQTVQRREFVRIPIMLDIELFVLDENIKIKNKTQEELKSLLKSQKMIKGYAYDLSAGGLGAILPESVDYGKELVCLILDDYFENGFIGKVVRSTQNKQADKKLYRVGVQFLDLNYQTEEKLVKYIFGKMRDQLKVR